MGKHFGNLQYLKGVTYYVLSPYELKPFTGMLNPGLKNVIRRFSENIIPMGIPILGAYIVYESTMTKYRALQRKNPDDYKDEV